MQSNLIIARKEKNVTQKELALLLNISTKAYAFKESGKTEFLMNEMFILSQYFGMSIENLFKPTILQNGV